MLQLLLLLLLQLLLVQLLQLLLGPKSLLRSPLSPFFFGVLSHSVVLVVYRNG